MRNRCVCQYMHMLCFPLEMRPIKAFALGLFAQNVTPPVEVMTLFAGLTSACVP